MNDQMMQLLLIDDSRLARRVALGIVGRLRPDWICLEAADAADALVLARQHEIDVALIDYNMPGVNGIVLARELLTVRPNIAMAIVSANIQDAVVAQAHAMDLAFIAKPLTDEALAPFIGGAALRRGRARS
jgi:CheY-like chemotaxis protein